MCADYYAPPRLIWKMFETLCVTNYNIVLENIYIRLLHLKFSLSSLSDSEMLIVTISSSQRGEF